MNVDNLELACTGWDSGDCQGTPLCPPRCPRFLDKHETALTVRRGDEIALDDLLEMYDAFGPGERARGVPPVTEPQQRVWLDTLLSKGHNVVVEADGRAVGHAVFTPENRSDPELAVFVHPNVHDRGVGTELCKHVIADAAAAGHDELVLHVAPENRAAVAIYRSLGFEIVSHDEDLEMVLSLADRIASDVRNPPAERDRSA
ncbi:N-acetyltransferase family protein [Halorubrum sp. DTA98]|uniref:GNAT family N-acetyltransferase n=1 Tax=Halorubrum sp. DTA98 TaxID=3402163 RepID=UPI003AAAE911